MAKREDIETAIWSDPDFLALSGPARSIYIWSFTNQRTGMSGIYKVARELVAMETGFDGKPLTRALTELQEQRFLYYDGRIMFVRTRVKRLRNSGDTIAKSIKSDIEGIGDHPFVSLWWQENGHRTWITKHLPRPENSGDVDGSTLPPPGPLEGFLGSGKGNGKGNSEGVGVGGEADAELPDDFPDEAIPLLDAAFPVVCEMARRHRSKTVTRYQVAQTIQPRWLNRAVVKGAHDCAAYWDRKGGLRDPNAAYRNWLEKSDEIAGPEPLGATLHQLAGRDSGRFSEYDRAAGL